MSSYTYITHVTIFRCGVFFSLKKKWNKTLEEFKIRFIRKECFLLSFWWMLGKSISSNSLNIKSTFRKCGLIPLNAENIDLSKILNEDKSIKQCKWCFCESLQDNTKESWIYMIQYWNKIFEMILKENIWMILKVRITPILVRCVMIYKKREKLLKKKFAKKHM